jgi:hypothetical protein
VLLKKGLRDKKHISVVFCNNRYVENSFRKTSSREFEPKTLVYGGALAGFSAVHTTGIVDATNL